MSDRQYATAAVADREAASLPLTGDWNRAAAALSHGDWAEAADHVRRATGQEVLDARETRSDWDAWYGQDA